MADSPNLSQGAVAQVHMVGHASPSPLAPKTGHHQESSPPRGPRTLLLRRGENGFGFTLRHFIVYPPESCYMLPGHERARIDEPMDTIFVKQVRANSPAFEAGLRTGDRVASVDGVPTRGEQYAHVVQRIQHAGPWLRLIVVSKDDDILQRYFGETAHNPETNQRPRLKSPDRVPQKQRRSTSMIPGPTSRSRQSWVCSPPGSENQGTAHPYKQREEIYKDSKMLAPSYRRPLEAHNQETLYDHPERPQRRQKDPGNQAPLPYRPQPDSRFDLYDRTRPESIYSRGNNQDEIYDRIKDPIYERVRGSDGYAKSLDPYPISRAEPQVPIYRTGRRTVSRRASEGSGMANEAETEKYGSMDALKSSNPGSRLSMESQRDSSPASKESLSSYDSNSTLTGNECSDDSVIMTRLRRSFEQKEEFLRRPSHPIGWLTPEEASKRIQREFYARPQKLQRQVWPPSEQQMRQQSPTRNSSLERKSKPSNQNIQRIRGEFDPDNEYSNQMDREDEYDERQPGIEEIQAIRDQLYSSLYDSNGQFVKENHFKYGPAGNNGNKINEGQQQFRSPSQRASNKAAFVTTLSRIHENVTAQQGGQGQDLRNGTSSLPSSPGPEKKNVDKYSAPPQGLQMVSRRARQFESGRLLSDDDEPTSDRTNLYKSELSRLSSKRSVPNVAVRKREFESKAEARDTRTIPSHRESKSLDSGKELSGNRVIPVGSKYIHCEPPAGYREAKDVPAMDTEQVHLRARSNSAESWEAVNGTSRRNARHTWQTEDDDDDDDEEDAKRNKAKRQDSYLQAVREQLERAPQKSMLRRQDAIREGDSLESRSEDPNDPLFPTPILDLNQNSESGKTTPNIIISSPPVRPNQLSILNPIRPLENSTDNSPGDTDVETPEGIGQILAPATGSPSLNGVVIRRQKNTQSHHISEEDRATRRVSYIKATGGERMLVDIDSELGESEPILSLRSNSIAGTQSTNSNLKDAEPVEREGPLHVKHTVIEGKRSTDRSWKQVWGVLRGPILYLYKDRHSQSPSTTGDGDAGQNVDVRCSLVDVAEDYTKRKHVLRVANPEAEVLLQTEDAASMALWLRAFHKHAAVDKNSDTVSSTSNQQAVPQTPGPTTPSATAQGGQRLSPLPSHKGIRKLTSFRNRSPTGQSPVNKTRKPSQVIEPLPSPKSKTWKGRVAKQLRRMHGQAGSPSSPTSQLPPEGATFKIPLELCPQSDTEFVPKIVEICTSIVEARGLEVIGIYRVPGNTAAISQLTESVNKGFLNINSQDPRWSDVNVISSLLKSFFRQLPDSLLTAELYPMFIDADKIEDPQRRMATIRKLLRDLPEHHYETLKYLMFHLKRVVEHSEVNKMEAKNLAIVFGPTLVRASGSRDNMVTMVTDMSHQCRIVESLLNNVDWFFCEEDLDDLSRLSVNLSLPADGSEVEPTSSTNHNLLLNNIHKVEGMREMVSARDIVSSIISAANRKIQRRRKGQDETDNDEHDDDKSRTKQDGENSPTARQSMALNERQCSVSEIVSMHENKSQSNNSASSVNSQNTNGTLTQSKYSPSQQQQPCDSPRLCEDASQSAFDTVSNISSVSNETRQSNDEVIRTYAGLSATTQERIRRFEQETKAMLQRDQHRQKREAEKREEERKRIEAKWQLAKREMENDDILDTIVDSTVTPNFLSERLSNLNERLSDRSVEGSERQSRSTTRISPVSIAVQQQPSSHQKAQASSQLSSILGEKMNNGVVKKFKTDKEPSMDSLYLPPARYGSLDSLHEVHSHPSPSPSHQHRVLPGDVSDDGSDLLTSLTSTFDKKWKSLVNPTCQLTPFDKPTGVKDDCDGSSAPTEVYRDPSLHKTPADKGSLVHPKNDIPEKDTDSTVTSSQFDASTPDNDRTVRIVPEMNITVNLLSENKAMVIDAAEKDENPKKSNSKTDVSDLPYSSKVKRFESIIKVDKIKTQGEDGACGASKNIKETKLEDGVPKFPDHEVDTSYSNKLEKFESMSQSNLTDSRSRLKRSESLNKKSDNVTSKLKRSESLNKHSDRLASPTNSKLKRSESLNKHSDRSESPNSKLKRSESLTKTEKTECNISKRRQSGRKEGATKLKRKNGMPERSIKRRHTVGGTKDFDKVHWLDNKLQTEAEKVVKNDISKPKKSQLRTSSPDLSSNRVNVADTSFLIEVSFRGPSNVVFNVTNARPKSLPDANLASKVFKVPLESHV